MPTTSRAARCWPTPRPSSRTTRAKDAIIGEKRPTAVPQVTFSERPHRARRHGDGAHWVGRNHSNNSLVMRFPGENVLFAVDFIPVNAMAFRDFPDAYIANGSNRCGASRRWISTSSRPVTAPLGTKADVRAFREYLEDLRAQVMAAGARRQVAGRDKERGRPRQVQGAGAATSNAPLNIEGMYRLVQANRRPNQKSPSGLPSPWRDLPLSCRCREVWMRPLTLGFALLAGIAAVPALAQDSAGMSSVAISGCAGKAGAGHPRSRSRLQLHRARRHARGYDPAHRGEGGQRNHRNMVTGTGARRRRDQTAAPFRFTPAQRQGRGSNVPYQPAPHPPAGRSGAVVLRQRHGDLSREDGGAEERELRVQLLDIAKPSNSEILTEQVVRTGWQVPPSFFLRCEGHPSRPQARDRRAHAGRKRNPVRVGNHVRSLGRSLQVHHLTLTKSRSRALRRSAVRRRRHQLRRQRSSARQRDRRGAVAGKRAA